MKAILLALAVGFSLGALAQAPGPAPAMPPAKQSFFYHYEWTRGAVLTVQEWKRGATIDHPRRDGLPAAPTGNEWREIDRNYVLVSRSTHAIVRVVAAPHPTVPGHSGGQP